MTPDCTDTFLNPKPSYALVAIRRDPGEMYGSKLARKIDTTYAHVVGIINELEDHSLIETEKIGRKRVIKLTETGQNAADNLGEFIDCVSGSPAALSA